MILSVFQTKEALGLNQRRTCLYVKKTFAARLLMERGSPLSLSLAWTQKFVAHAFSKRVFSIGLVFPTESHQFEKRVLCGKRTNVAPLGKFLSLAAD